MTGRADNAWDSWIGIQGKIPKTWTRNRARGKDEQLEEPTEDASDIGDKSFPPRAYIVYTARLVSQRSKGS